MPFESIITVIPLPLSVCLKATLCIEEFSVKETVCAASVKAIVPPVIEISVASLITAPLELSYTLKAVLSLTVNVAPDLTPAIFL